MSALALVLSLVALGVTTATAGVYVPPAGKAKTAAPIFFPLVGKTMWWDNYGDPRGNGAHAAIDIAVPRRSPVIAVEAGTIKWWTTSSLAGCMLYHYGASGTTYLYIHLNNDATLKNDNTAGCKAGATFSTKNGAKVEAGQQIAWSGDSGDADGNPHLHFEVHPNDGPDVNPMPYLETATRLLFPGKLGAPFVLALRGTPVSGGVAALELNVTAVRWWPNGRWVEIDPRAIEVQVPPETDVEPELLKALQAPVRRDLSSRKGQQLTIFTEPAQITADAQRGDPLALVAARIVLR